MSTLVFQVLLSLGARVNVHDKRKRNAFHCAADSCYAEACELLLEQAVRHHCAVELLNMQELYLGAEQCFLVRGKLLYAYYFTVKNGK